MKQFLIGTLSIFIFSSCFGQTDMGFLSETGYVKDEIKKEEKHHYKIELSETELVMISLMQENVDLTVGYLSPTGAERTLDGYNGKNGPEPMLIRADTSGTYLIKVAVFEEKGSGSYVLEILDRQIKKPSVAEQLDQELAMWAELDHMPGCGTAIVSKDAVLYSKGFGKADKSKNDKYDTETIQNIGSVSKTTIALSIMKLVDEGRLSLDTEINDILPFSVTNPYHPDVPITVEHLATHTSSINEMPAYEKSYLIVGPHNIKPEDVSKGEYRSLTRYQKNKEVPMEEFLENILSKNGSWYKKKKTFLKSKPGTKYQYSNVAATLAAFVVEQITGLSHADYTRQIIFEPLGMSSTGWAYDDIDADKLAQLYFSNGRIALPRYQLITYPDGGLRTSVEDLSRYLQELIRGRAGQGTLLEPSSYEEMMRSRLTPQHFGRADGDENAGIFWDINGESAEGHSGGDPGIVTLMYFNPEKLVGGIIMTNCGLDDPMARKQFSEMWSAINYYGEKIGAHLIRIG